MSCILRRTAFKAIFLALAERGGVDPQKRRTAQFCWITSWHTTAVFLHFFVYLSHEIDRRVALSFIF